MEGSEGEVTSEESEDGYIYDIDHALELSEARIRRDKKLSPESKDAIFKFIEKITAQGVKKQRQYFYEGRLRIIAQVMGDSFLDPTDEIITHTIITLQKTKGRRGIYSPASINDFKTSMKKFYGWYEKGKFKSLATELKLKSHPYKEKRPEDLITKEQLQGLINACFNERDKAIIALLYDSGIRIGEALTLRVRDVIFDTIGLKIMVETEGKSGSRPVRCVGNSNILMHDYKDKFRRNEPKDYFFVQLDGSRLKYHDVSTMLYKVAKRAGLEHKSAHLFRHTRATAYATRLGGPALMQIMGWRSPKTAQTYIHFSPDAADSIVLDFYGIQQKKDEKGRLYTPQICPRCGTENGETGISYYCLKCGMPLDKNLLVEVENVEKKAEAAILGSSIIDNNTKKLLKNFDPEFKDKLLDAILSQIINDPKLREIFVGEMATRQQKSNQEAT